MTKAGVTSTYKYDDSGIRTQKTVAGVTTNYYLNGDRVETETNGTDTIQYFYDEKGDLFSFNIKNTTYPSGATFYYVRNGQNDITGILDSTGTQVVSYVYDSWGKLISTTGTLATTIGVENPYRYRGYRYDVETGLYYLQSRYYNPETCRMLNADSQVSTGNDLVGMNMFAYCNNNPVNMTDDDGECPFWNGFVDFFVDQWNTIKAAVLKPIDSYIDYVTNAWNWFPVAKIVRDEIKTVAGTLEDVSTGNIDNLSYGLGQRTAIATEIVATVGIAKGIGTAVNKAMPKIIESRLFSTNDGWGIKKGNFEFLYREPNVQGGTFASYESIKTKWRISWDPANTFHYHTGFGAEGRIHRGIFGVK